MRTASIIKSILIIILSVLLFKPSNAQLCVPGNDTIPGFYPDTITNLPLAVANLQYNAAMTVVVPLDTNYSGVLFVIDSLGITGITGLPSGFTYLPNTASGYWAGGISGCIMISGMASYAQRGIYPLTLQLNMIAGGMQIPSTFNGYRLEIVDSVFTNCFDTIGASAIDTCFSFIPNSAYINNYTYNGSDSMYVTWVVSSPNNTQQGYVTVVYPVDSNGCHVLELTIVCSKSTTYNFTDQLLITKFITNISRVKEIETNVFPNPATDKITINVPAKSVSTAIGMEIINIRGQVVKSLKINDNSVNMDISDLSKGVYIIKIQTDKEIVTKKFIKE